MTSDRETIEDLLPDLMIEGPIGPRYNIAPSQPVATVLNDGKHRLTWTQWGLIPSWSKDPTIGQRMINARAETVAEKPSFRAPFKRHRCLILADGFFEWKRVPGNRTKLPFLFRMKSGKPFAFAGLWDCWGDNEGGEILSSTIITTKPNRLVAKVHDRMPVILPRERHGDWLSIEEKQANELNALLAPYPDEEMESWPVSRMVNSPKNDIPECIQPIQQQEPPEELTLF